MSLKDTFARGFVWKLAGLLALAAFGWFAGIGEANAATYTCNVNPSTCSREQAYAECATRGAAAIAGGPQTWGWQCVTGTKMYTAQVRQPTTFVTVAEPNGFRWGEECPGGAPWNDATKKCEVPCSSRPNLGPRWVKGYDGAASSAMCHESCEYTGSLDAVTDQTTVDGEVYTRFAAMTPFGTNCAVGGVGYGTEVGTPPADADGDGSSDGNDTAPANPGQGAGGGSEPGGEDGGQPGEGSGNGNQSTGGGNCATPPNSHGDQIAAQVAYQTWATRCAIERAQEADGTLKTKQATTTGTGGTGTGGTGTGGLGTCTASEVGTALCTMKEAIASIKGFFDGIGSEAGGLDTSEGETEEPGSVWADEGGEELDLDASGFGMAGGGCPPAPTYMGYSLDAAGNMCLFATIIGALVLAAGYVQAAYIIGRA